MNTDGIRDALSRLVREGDTVVWPQGTGEPELLVTSLMQVRDRIGPFRVFVGMSVTDSLLPEHADFVEFLTTGGTLTNHRLGRHQQVLPSHVSQLPTLVREGLLPTDVVLIKVARHPRLPLYSLGATADYIHEAIARARVVIAEVSTHAPFILGDTILTRDQLDLIIATEAPLRELPRREPDAESRTIAQIIADFIPDGATIQLGLGGVPDALVDALADRNDLGVHSGMISDPIMDLVESGVVTGRAKSIDTGLIIAGAVFGTQKLYDWAHLNPVLNVRRLSYVHAAAVIDRLSPFVSVNSAIEVDLTGQVNAEIMNDKYIGAIGGHNDFTRYGMRSPGGASVIALNSGAKGNTISRIVPRLPAGIVTTSRADADVIVTEYGSVSLRGKTLSERARALIDIAHPDHRNALREHADTQDQIGWR